MQRSGEPFDRDLAVLDAYIIEDIKRQEEARRSQRSRLHIDPAPPVADDEGREEEPAEDDEPIHIDIDAPTIRISG